MRQVLILLAAVLYASAHTPAAEVVLWPRQMIGGERWFCTEGGARRGEPGWLGLRKSRTDRRAQPAGPLRGSSIVGDGSRDSKN